MSGSLSRAAVAAVALFAMFVLSEVARAAPPANDNRAAAEVIPTFPATIQGTTVEATVERLDPQVSDCGRIEGTVWYRINQAPDGTIVLDVQGNGLAPVLRVYDLLPNSIDELTCDSAARNGKATASFRTDRGKAYLVLVGRKPSTADAPFTLTARLYLPPTNDRLRGAKRILRLPAKVSGSTFGATSDDNDPSECRLADGTVWFALPKVTSGRIAVRLTARGDLDAAVALVKQVRSQASTAACRATDARGRALVAAGLDAEAKYFLVVGQQSGSPPGEFTIEILAAQPAEVAPGRYLAGGRVTSTLNGLTDVNDIYWVTMEAGRPYRLALNSTGCPSLTLSSKTEQLRSINCRGYATFTPGPDGGGRYVIELTTSPATQTVGYHLQFAPATMDDFGVGRHLANLATAHGSLSPRGVDLVDVYHFDVGARADVRLRLSGGSGYAMTLLDGDGGRIQASKDEIRRRLDRGRYVVAVSADVGAPGATYGLSLVVRALTTTTLKTAAGEVPPRTLVTLDVATTVAGNGWIEVQIDRFDPLTGWQFYRLHRVRAPGGQVTWMPPAQGKWRARASYLGTLRFSPSRSGYVHVLVATPLPAVPPA